MSQNFACLTFFIDLQLQDVADLGEDVVREGGQQGDALQEVQLVLHLLDAGSLHQSEVSILVRGPIRREYSILLTYQRRVLPA